VSISLRPKLRLLLWIILIAVLLGGQFLWLFLLRGIHLFHRDAVLIGGQILLCAAVLGIAVLLRTAPADAIRLRRRPGEWMIILGVIFLQGSAIWLLLPGLSQDVLRYRADGRMWLSGKSPYAHAPIDWAQSDAIDSLVPFPDVRTIYPGTAEASFALGAWIERSIGAAPREVPIAPPSAQSAPWRWYLAHAASPYGARVFRTMFALAMVLAVVVAFRLLRQMEASAWWAVLLGWNPLATLEIGGMGHADAVGLLMILLALLALARTRWMRAGGWLALATGVKPLALLLLPFALRAAKKGEPHRESEAPRDSETSREGEAFWEGEASAEPRRDRQTRLGGSLALPDASMRYSPALAARIACGFGVVALIALILPFLYQHGYTGWRQTAATYSHAWEANGSLYNAITRGFGKGDDGRAMSRAKEMARLLAGAVVLGAGVIAWDAGASVATAGYVLTMAALLAAPVAYPWYALWPLCFVPFLDGRAGWSALIWSGTISISYLLWRSPDWRLSPGALLVEYVPVYTTVAMEIAWAIRQVRFQPHRISLKSDGIFTQ
jgi:hypothetical protein